jgi:uncharacterized protein (DUF924 family)
VAPVAAMLGAKICRRRGLTAICGEDEETKMELREEIGLAKEVVAFWRAAGPDKWFAKDDAFDAAIRARFLDLTHAAREGRCDHWIEAGGWEETLALLILLDQFPRNLFRGSGQAFASDAKGLAVAREALARRIEDGAPLDLAPFFHLPFMHSEDLADQELCVALSRWRAGERKLHFAVLHRDIIAKFGRFPHRNAALGRETTLAERDYLAKPDAFLG